MPNVPQFYWAANRWKERPEKWESTEAPESLRRRNNESCKEELPWSALLHPGPCSFIGHDISENVRIREDDDKKLRTEVRDLAESNNDGAGNLIVFPQTFQALLRYGVNHLFSGAEGTPQVYKTGDLVKPAQVKEWAFVCFSGVKMVTPEKLDSFVKNLVRMCQAIGMDLNDKPRICLQPIVDLNDKPRICLQPIVRSSYMRAKKEDLSKLLHILKDLEVHGRSLVQLVLIVLPGFRAGIGSEMLSNYLRRIQRSCAKHGVIYHQCFYHEVTVESSNTYMRFIACAIKDKAVALNMLLDSIEKIGGDPKPAVLGEEIEENGQHIDSGKEIIGDGGSKQQGGLDVHALGSSGSSETPIVSDVETQEDSSGKEQGGGETQDDSSDKQHEDGGSQDESLTLSDGFPGSVDVMKSEHDEWCIDSDGFRYRNRKKKVSDGSARFLRGSVDALQVNKVGNVKSWACVSFSMGVKATGKFLAKLIRTCRALGMAFYSWPTSAVHVKPVSSTKVEDTLWHMHDTISEIFSVDGEEIGLLFVILPDKEVGAGTYEKVDEVCQKLGFVYQYCSPEDARNASESYLNTTALEINDKVVRRGADLQSNFVMPFVAGKDPTTIVFGADILRSAEEDSNISIASVVATFDWPVSSRYRAVVSEQPYKEVAIKNLHNEENEEESMVSYLLLNFSRKTKRWPSRIIFFRNGVDEGQLSFIASQEIAAIKMACTSITKMTLPVTYVVVGRAESAVGEDSSTKFEFSCSHPLVGGTGGTNDVAYRVLQDDNDLHTDDKLKSICINLCTDRVRWAYPKVSMAPPAYYAHLAALYARAQVKNSSQESYDGESTASARRQLPPPFMLR